MVLCEETGPKEIKGEPISESLKSKLKKYLIRLNNSAHKLEEYFEFDDQGAVSEWDNFTYPVGN